MKTNKKIEQPEGFMGKTLSAAEQKTLRLMLDGKSTDQATMTQIQGTARLNEMERRGLVAKGPPKMRGGRTTSMWFPSDGYRITWDGRKALIGAKS